VNGRYLLDTNIVTALNRGEIAVQERIAAASEIKLPSIVLGELYHGAFNSPHAIETVRQIDLIAANYSILFVDVSTARHYGEIKTQLRREGRPIPENDLWIAALGKQTSATIATRDQHFLNIPGVNTEVW
jgi:tRNA(fMet)-specific endonuclease VapC